MNGECGYAEGLQIFFVAPPIILCGGACDVRGAGFLVGDVRIMLEDDGYTDPDEGTAVGEGSPPELATPTSGGVVSSFTEMFGNDNDTNGVWAIDVGTTVGAADDTTSWSAPEGITPQPAPETSVPGTTPAGDDFEGMSDEEFRAYLKTIENPDTPTTPIVEPTHPQPPPPETATSDDTTVAGGIIQKITGALDTLTSWLLRVPGVKKVGKNITPGTVFARAVTITLLILLLLVGVKIVNTLNSSEGTHPVGAVTELPDGGALTITQIERHHGETTATISNTGDRVEKNITIEATGTAINPWNPGTWFNPTPSTCHGTIDTLDPEVSNTVTLTCDKQLTGLNVTYHAKAAADE